MSAIATIGGGATSFQTFSDLSLNLLPSLDYSASNLLANCARQAQQRLRRRRHDPRYNYRMDGPNREGALFCRSGTWLEILDKRTAEYEARKKELTRPEYVRGTRKEHSRFSILEFMSVAFGLVSIRGRESQRYLCMDREGRLYGAVKQNYSSECVFMEEMLENYYNLYSSCSYGTRKKPWYIALRKTGRPRKGKNSRKRRKSSHFLVVHFDGGRFPSRTYTDYTRESTGNADVQSTNRLPSRAYRYGYGDDASLFYRSKQHHSPPPPLPPPPKPRSLSEILTGTLNNDHSAIHTAQRSMPTLGFVRRTPQRNSDTVGGRDLTVEERKSNRRKRGRKARLEREERQRQRRRLELELKRANPLHERRTQEGRQQSSRQRKERSFSGT